jgi:signal transduction histidine kinase
LDFQRVEVVVSNQGPAIPEDDLEKIFKRFYRSASAGPLSGSGLGLSIVRSLVELHGGTVRAFNPPGAGAAFAFVLLRVQPVA